MKFIKKKVIRTALFLIKWLTILFLPFFCLIRTSTYLYEFTALNHWIAILCGVVFATLILAIYLFVLQRKISRRPRKMPLKKKLGIIALIFGLLCLYSGLCLFTISPKNTKNSAVQSEFAKLHPILKLSLGTFFLINPKAVVTDLSRTPEDYTAMGIKKNARSLHFIQEDGYTHAVDLRTKGRPFLVNIATQAFFQLNGFFTLRHSGTADHLHIHLALPRH